MDTLAHGLAGCVVGVAVLPDVARRYPGRTLWASAVLANAPDVDFALLLFSDELWLYHHRGLTHSLPGMTLMIPFGIWAARRLLKHAAEGLSTRRLALFVALTMLLGHTLLDTMTSFGLMPFYPLSFERVSGGLMFIVDPLFSLIGLVGVVLLAKWRYETDAGLRRAAFGVIAAICLLWSAEAFARRAARTLAESAWAERGIPTAEVHTYPMVTAPMVWQAVSVSDRGYTQSVISFWPKIRGAEILHTFDDVPTDYKSGAFCGNANYNDEARAKFERYNSWGHPVVCNDHENAGIQGCRCFVLKYSIAVNRRARFGALWIAPSGQSQMLKSESHPDDKALFRSLF